MSQSSTSVFLYTWRYFPDNLLNVHDEKKNFSGGKQQKKVAVEHGGTVVYGHVVCIKYEE